MAEIKPIEDSHENAEETLKFDAEAIPKGGVRVDDSGEKELEAKEDKNEAQGGNLGPVKYKVMTINMNGKAVKAVKAVKPKKPVKKGADYRRDMIVEFLRNYDPDVVFCQELPGLFNTVLNHNHSDSPSREWESTETTKEAGVLWNGNRFKGNKKNFQSTDSRMTKIRDLLLKKGNREVQHLLPRTSFVKLTEHGPKNPRSFIAVSYHGRYDINEENRKKIFSEGLVKFTQYLCEKEGNIPFLIGGDFNFDTTKLPLPGIEFGEYTMASRSQQEGKIPFKDNFCWEYQASSTASTSMIIECLEPCVLNQIKKDGDWSTNKQDRSEDAADHSADKHDAEIIVGFLLDHDPIVGRLAYADTSTDTSPDTPADTPADTSPDTPPDTPPDTLADAFDRSLDLNKK